MRALVRTDCKNAKGTLEAGAEGCCRERKT